MCHISWSKEELFQVNMCTISQSFWRFSLYHPCNESSSLSSSSSSSSSSAAAAASSSSSSSSFATYPHFNFPPPLQLSFKQTSINWLVSHIDSCFSWHGYFCPPGVYYTWTLRGTPGLTESEGMIPAKSCSFSCVCRILWSWGFKCMYMNMYVYLYMHIIFGEFIGVQLLSPFMDSLYSRCRISSFLEAWTWLRHSKLLFWIHTHTHFYQRNQCRLFVHNTCI